MAFMSQLSSHMRHDGSADDRVIVCDPGALLQS